MFNTILQYHIIDEDYHALSKDPKDKVFLLKEFSGDLDVPPIAMEPHTHDYYCMGILIKGTTDHVVDLQTITVDGPALLLLNADQVHQHNPVRNCHMVSICFLPDFLMGEKEEVFENLYSVFSQPLAYLKPAMIEELRPFIDLIIQQQEGRNDIDILRSLFRIILRLTAGYCHEQRQPASDSKKNELYQGFNVALKQSFKNNHQVAHYAEMLNVTPEMLTITIKQYTDKTPKQIIDDRLVMEAKRLLYWSTKTVREIAWELGFETDAYFNRFFKKHTSRTPKEFQRRARKDAAITLPAQVA